MIPLQIDKAVEVLKSGGLVIFPTDTVYGIGCRFDDKKATDRIHKIKGTPKDQQFPVLVSKLEQVEKLANINKTVQDLINKYWPGGLTVILPRNPNPGLEYIDKPGLQSEKIGLRMPNSSLVKTLIEKAGVPVIGTSANFHGSPTPRSYEDLDPEFTKHADFVIKGKCQKGIESTVVDTTCDPPKILRKGAVKLNDT